MGPGGGMNESWRGHQTQSKSAGLNLHDKIRDYSDIPPCIGHISLIFTEFSLNQLTGPILSLSCYVCLYVCVSVCATFL